MRVLHLIPSVSLRRGGPSQAVINMVTAQRAAGIDALIVSTNDDVEGELDVPLGTISTYRGVPVLFFSRWSPPLRVLREFAYSRPLLSWLQNNLRQYDVLHVHALFSACTSFGMRIARKQGIPYVCRIIGQLSPWSLAQSWTP